MAQQVGCLLICFQTAVTWVALSECIGVYAFWLFFLKTEAFLSEWCLFGFFLNISDAFVLPVEDFK